MLNFQTTQIENRVSCIVVYEIAHLGGLFYFKEGVMYPRINYEMTEEDLKEILDSCKPVPMIMLQCGTPSSPQENANRAWKRLGDKMGFDSLTVQPIQGKSNRYFSAIPNETEQQRVDRVNKEFQEKKAKDINDLELSIKEDQDKLKELKKL